MEDGKSTKAKILSHDVIIFPFTLSKIFINLKQTYDFEADQENKLHTFYQIKIW